MFELMDLKENPFRVGPDTRYFYETPKHAAVLDLLYMSINECAGIDVIYGDYGTGKSTLAKIVERKYSGRDDCAVYSVGDVNLRTPFQFYQRLLSIFGVVPEKHSTVSYRAALEQFAADIAIDKGKYIILLIDEAECLAPVNIDIIRTIVNFELEESKIFHFVLFGQLELLPKIRKKPNFVDRVNLSYVLNPLTQQELTDIIVHRIKVASINQDNPPNFFTEGSVVEIYKFSKGFPRRALILCDELIKEMIRRDMSKITEELTDEVADRMIQLYGERQVRNI